MGSPSLKIHRLLQHLLVVYLELLEETLVPLWIHTQFGLSVSRKKTYYLSLWIRLERPIYLPRQVLYLKSRISKFRIMLRINC